MSDDQEWTDFELANHLAAMPASVTMLDVSRRFAPDAPLRLREFADDDAPAIDCRTCKHLHESRCLFAIVTGEECVNGNEYVAGEPLQLWKASEGT